MSHAQSSDAIHRSIRAGVATVEHAFLGNDEVIHELAETSIALVPTLVVTDVWAHDLEDLPLETVARQERIKRLHSQACERAIRLGAQVIAGTDTGVRGVMPDYLWREVSLLRAHGLSTAEAIMSATSRSARALGIEAEVGTVEVGKIADLILVDGNPLTDLSVLRDPGVVVQGGRLVDLTGRDQRRQELESAPGEVGSSRVRL
jgi:imidazolonepropionase-like amidohydrolase